MNRQVRYAMGAAIGFVIVVAAGSGGNDQSSALADDGQRYATGAGDFDLSWFTIDGGGGTSSGGKFAVRGTIGQPDPGLLIGGGFELRGGFWTAGGVDTCPWDLNGDGEVGPVDLATVLGAWGPCPGCPQDFNGDGVVGPVDLATLLGSWGLCP